MMQDQYTEMVVFLHVNKPLEVVLAMCGGKCL
jgi:hypothetical protein